MAEACRCETGSPEYPVDQGEMARVSGVFSNLETGVAVDPSVVTFTYRLGSGTAKTLQYGEDEEVVREEAGVYHVDMPTTKAGVYRWRWASSGDFVGIREGQVTVRPSGVL